MSIFLSELNLKKNNYEPNLTLISFTIDSHFKPLSYLELKIYIFFYQKYIFYFRHITREPILIQPVHNWVGSVRFW